MSNWHPYNPNPTGSRVGDCTVRAITKATGQDWETAYVGLCLYGFMMRNMPSGNCVWAAYLRRHGYRGRPVDAYPFEKITVAEFCREHPAGTFVLGCDGHVVAVEDGEYWDSWDSGGEVVIYYWEKET